MCNGITAMKYGDIIVEDVEGIKYLTTNHFKERFNEPHFRQPKLERVVFKEIFVSESLDLENSVKMMDLKEFI